MICKYQKINTVVRFLITCDIFSHPIENSSIYCVYILCTKERTFRKITICFRDERKFERNTLKFHANEYCLIVFSACLSYGYDTGHNIGNWQ